MPGWRTFVVTTTATLQTVTAVPCFVHGAALVSQVSQNAVYLNNGATRTLTAFNISTAPGSVVVFGGEEGVIFDTSLVAGVSGATTGKVAIFFKPRGEPD